jgi:polysaccharide export outer membrane protein
VIRQVLLTLAVILAAAVASPCGAASTSPAVATEAGGSYRLRSEDVIEITVLGIPQLDKTVTILPDGTISYPRLGTVRAEGKTLGELKLFLYEKLDQFYNIVDITVSVKSMRPDRATVSGAVRTPGIYEIRRGWTVQELLAAAGGLAVGNGPPAPDQMRATLSRKTGQRIPLNLAQLLSQQGAPNPPLVEPDDVLSVEDLAIQVTVEGEVKKPGGVTLPPGATVLDALQAAGGGTDKAALSQARIRRGAQTLPVNLRALGSGKAGADIPTLQRFDTLFIPENKNQFLVMGGVRNPGKFLIPEDEPLSLVGAITLAGGHVPRAKLKEVSLFNASPSEPRVDGKSAHKTLDVEKMLKGDMSQSVTVRPGDVIFVPDPKDPKTPFNYQSLLSTALIFFGL